MEKKILANLDNDKSNKRDKYTNANTALEIAIIKIMNSCKQNSAYTF